MIFADLTVTALLICCAAFLGTRCRPALRFLIFAQTVFWIFGYLVRAFVLLYIHPIPNRGDPIADPRIANGDYSAGVRLDLTVVNLCLATYLVVMLVFVLVFERGRRSRPTPRLFPGHSVTVLLHLYVLGWAGRLVILGAGTSPTLALFASLASAAAFILVIRIDRLHAWQLAGLFVLEFGWASLAASKTPIFGLLAGLVLRAIIRSGRRLAVTILGVIIVSIPTFFVIQAVKRSKGVLFTASDIEYPDFLRPAVSILARFDFLSAVTDATTARPHSWFSVTTLLHASVDTLVPRLFNATKGLTEGQLWAQEVRPLTIGAINPDVSLAQGPGAEGYLVGGLGGVVLMTSLVAIVTIGCSLALQSHSVFLTVTSVYLVDQSVLLEGGFLASMQALGKGLEVGLIAAVVATAVTVLGHWYSQAYPRDGGVRDAFAREGFARESFGRDRREPSPT